MKGLLSLLMLLLITVAHGQDSRHEPKESRRLQVSLLPSIPPYQGITQVSINLFASHNGGVDGVELGAFMNSNSGDVRWVQLAGFNNLTFGNVYGVQSSGFANVTTGYIQGAQLSGFGNYSRDITGIQLSGFANITIGMVKGVQSAGFANVTTSDVTGLQLASFFNHSGDLTGAQISGFANKANKVKGVQLGIINMADTVESGVTIGLVNIVKKGMMAIEIEHNDVLDVNASFKSGTSRLYGIVSAGTQVANDKWWGIGAGFGTEKAIKGQFFTGAEITSYSIVRNQDFEDFDLFGRLVFNVGYKPSEKFAVIIGPAANFLLDEKESVNNEIYQELGENPIYEKDFDNRQLKAWVGYRLAIRF
jgi:hypothetical protein